MRDTRSAERDDSLADGRSEGKRPSSEAEGHHVPVI
jgi:hypothetical protein